MPKLNVAVEGRAVQQQLGTWDLLLEMRIRVQTLLIEANKMPQDGSYWKAYKSETNGKKEKAESLPPLEVARKSLRDFMDSLVQLKDELMSSSSETMELLSGKSGKVKAVRNPLDEEITSSEDEEEKELHEDDSNKETDAESMGEHSDDNGAADDTSEEQVVSAGRPRKRTLDDSEYEVELKRRHESFTPFRNQIIQKWNDRTQLASGKLNKRSFSAFQVSTLKQIEQIMGDQERLIKRTQLKRTQYGPIGKSKTDSAEKNEEVEGNYDSQIFDDDDFYHQMLRELIERKTSNVTDPIQLSRHWLELQKLRCKTKKKVDTKASKARKIRYEVYSKLVNLMAPADETPMTEHARKELFASLFGSKT